jgi:membrane protease YdiL (CAAX protease family)
VDFNFIFQLPSIMFVHLINVFRICKSLEAWCYKIWCFRLLKCSFLFSLTSTFSYAIYVQAVNNPILKEILLGSDISKAACVLLYCFVTPLLEETVYRGFLLTSISSTMKWQQAILISSVIFSAAHFSAENFLQLIIIGCVLGSSCCWSGNLSSSIVVHSLYNAMTLMLTLLS